MAEIPSGAAANVVRTTVQFRDHVEPTNAEPSFWASSTGSAPPSVAIRSNNNTNISPPNLTTAPAVATNSIPLVSSNHPQANPLPKHTHPYKEPGLGQFDQSQSYQAQRPQQPVLHHNPPAQNHHAHFTHRKNSSEIPNVSQNITTNSTDNLDQPLENNNSTRHSWHPDSIRHQQQHTSESHRAKPDTIYSSQARHQHHRPVSSSTQQMASAGGPLTKHTSAEEWKERGAASIIKTETDEHGKVSTRVIKKGVQDFEFGRTLGIGSYSTVVGATDKQNQRSYAIKILDKRHIIKEKKVKYVDIEKNTLNRLGDHPGIVRLYYTFQDESSLYFVLDFASNGELLSLVKSVSVCTVHATQFFHRFSNVFYRWVLWMNSAPNTMAPNCLTL